MSVIWSAISRIFVKPLNGHTPLTRRAPTIRERALVHHNLGVEFQQQGDPISAEASYWNALAIDRSLLVAHRNLGTLFFKQQKWEKAESRFQAAVEGLPQTNSEKLAYAESRHWLAVLQEDNTKRFPDLAVKALFDSYAEKFEEHLLNSLNYMVPQILHNELQAVLQGMSQFRLERVADLGCGTGLMGCLIREIGAPVTRLEGVDLSPKMLAKAASKGCYDVLLEGEMIAIYQPRAPKEAGNEPHRSATDHDLFDLVVAADVFCYVGDLDSVFLATQQWLKPGSLFAFSVETHNHTIDGCDYKLKKTGRYSHNPLYIRDLAKMHGFVLARSKCATLRIDAGKPVEGEIFVLRRLD